MMVDPVVEENDTDIGYDVGLLTVNEDGTDIGYDAGLLIVNGNCDEGTTDEDIESAIIAECTSALNQEIFSDMQDDSSQSSDPSNSVSVSPVSPKIYVPSIDGFVYKATVISDFFRHKDVSADRELLRGNKTSSKILNRSLQKVTRKQFHCLDLCREG